MNLPMLTDEVNINSFIPKIRLPDLPLYELPKSSLAIFYDKNIELFNNITENFDYPLLFDTINCHRT